jgi:hypothetical protein
MTEVLTSNPYMWHLKSQQEKKESILITPPSLPFFFFKEKTKTIQLFN